MRDQTNGYEVGNVVLWHSPKKSGQQRGVIESFTQAGSAVVRGDDGQKETFRHRSYGGYVFRLETDRDRAECRADDDHRVALDAWKKEMPSFRFVGAVNSWGGGVIDGCRIPSESYDLEEMKAIHVELGAFIAWYARKPERGDEMSESEDRDEATWTLVSATVRSPILPLREGRVSIRDQANAMGVPAPIGHLVRDLAALGFDVDPEWPLDGVVTEDGDSPTGISIWPSLPRG